MPPDRSERPGLFPPDFLWGAATSSFQIEGSPLADGAGASIWTDFCAQPQRILDASNGDLACDHYRRYAEDIQLMQSLGLHSYRFSIAWARVLPRGIGAVNQAGLDFYRRLIDGLLEAGISPAITLYHWDLPSALQAQGGWLNPAIAEWFAEYAERMFGEFADRVPTWFTLNEPWVAMHCGHMVGEHAPGHTTPAELPLVAHHQLLAHAAAVRRYRSFHYDGQIGLVVNLAPKHPASQSAADTTAAQRADAYFNRWFLDAVFRGSYPSELREMFGDDWPEFAPAQMAAIQAPIDFLGINYYSRNLVKAAPQVPVLSYTESVPNGAPVTDIGWEVYPDGLRETLLRVTQDYGPIPLYVTENGAAYHAPGSSSVASCADDPARVDYFRSHLLKVHEAIQQGCDVRGYFAWSLLDNFEWAFGYSQRFGLVHVDYPTQQRTLKHSAHYYREVIQSQGTHLTLPVKFA